MIDRGRIEMPRGLRHVPAGSSTVLVLALAVWAGGGAVRRHPGMRVAWNVAGAGRRLGRPPAGPPRPASSSCRFGTRPRSTQCAVGSRPEEGASRGSLQAVQASSGRNQDGQGPRRAQRTCGVPPEAIKAGQGQHSKPRRWPSRLRRAAQGAGRPVRAERRPRHDAMVPDASANKRGQDLRHA